MPESKTLRQCNLTPKRKLQLACPTFHSKVTVKARVTVVQTLGIEGNRFLGCSLFGRTLFANPCRDNCCVYPSEGQLPDTFANRFALRRRNFRFAGQEALEQRGSTKASDDSSLSFLQIFESDNLCRRSLTLRTCVGNYDLKQSSSQKKECHAQQAI